MTNRNMVKPAADPAQDDAPNRTPLPAMPAAEGSGSPTTSQEPIDSPQPNTSANRAAPAPGETGLSTPPRR